MAGESDGDSGHSTGENSSPGSTFFLSTLAIKEGLQRLPPDQLATLSRDIIARCSTRQQTVLSSLGWNFKDMCLDTDWEDVAVLQAPFNDDPTLRATLKTALDEVVATYLSETQEHFLDSIIELQEPMARYFQSGDPKELDRPLIGLRSLVEHGLFSAIDYGYQAGILVSLSGALMNRYTDSGDDADLNEAISLNQRALNSAPDTSSMLAGMISFSGECLLARYRQHGAAEDLDLAISLCRRALDVHSKFSGIADDGLLQKLAECLYENYLRAGNLDDLEEGIRLLRQAAEINSIHVVGLSLVLWARYRRSGSLTDLDQAVRLVQQGLETASLSLKDRAIAINNLGLILLDYYERSKDLEHLNLAIEYAQQALNMTTVNSTARPGRLDNLSNCFLTRYAATRNPADLEKGIEFQRSAARLVSPNSAYKPRFLNNLGEGLYLLYKLNNQLADLEESARSLEEALQLTPPISPEKPLRLGNLGRRMQEHYERTRDATSLSRAVELFLEACELGLALDAAMALTHSKIWGNWAMQRSAWSEAAQAFGYGIRAIDQLFRTQFFRSDKEAWLREAQTIPNSAAYSFARDADVVSAVLALESGRTRLLADAIESYRLRLEHLAASGEAELFENYRAAARRVIEFEDTGMQAGDSGLSLSVVPEWQQARLDLDASIQAMRQLPGFEDLFGRVKFEDIQDTLTGQSGEEAGRAIGVYLIVTRFGGMALIVHGGGTERVPIDLSEADLHDLLRGGHEAGTGGYVAGQVDAGNFPVILNELIESVGAKILTPIMRRVELLLADTINLSSPPNLILIPTGLLSLLPFHAARYEIDGQWKDLLERFVVTYAPSAKLLRHCRTNLGLLVDTPVSFLGIGNPLPLPESAAALSFARLEVEEIAKMFGERADLVLEWQAHRATIEKKLNSASYVHFSCHGYFDLEEPLASGLLLSNGELLSLHDLLAQATLDKVRLVTLSACQTAVTDVEGLPEEAVGLPSGFLQLGVPGVIGSLWPVNDLSTALLMLKFYEYHLGGTETAAESRMSPAAALRSAQLWLMKATSAELVECFKAFKQPASEAPNHLRPYVATQERLLSYALHNPDDQPFRHPYYWAPFAFSGV
jgi:CHAT domain-containing protein